MDEISGVLNGIAALIWPVLAIIIVFLFKPAVSAIIESARSRKFTLKIGGQELTMEEVSEQQRGIITDLQSQILELRQIVEKPIPGAAKLIERTSQTRAAPSKSVLWVDDNPRNNSFLVQQLLDAGITVDLAVSTTEALSRLSQRTYSIVVSDMGRSEAGSYIAQAGIDLLRRVREQDSKIPFFIYCSHKKALEYGEAAEKYGATAVTSSPTQLAGMLKAITEG
jgi:CheY-like chemotaxis protein